jgi:L-fuculokinase
VSGPLIGVFDVGKTNSKITIVEPATGRELWSARRANQTVRGPAGRELDVVSIEAWLLESLRSAPERERVEVIVPIAHGAAAVLVGHDGEVLAAPDYEDADFDDVAADYAALRDPYSRTFSPHLPQGLNLGRQLFYLQERRSALYARAAHLLLYPQYWAWRLSGVMAAEVTSLGTHTDLWWPHEAAYSWTARERGWASLMPPMRRATDRLGALRASVAAATGLDASCEVACGIHDSNASYLRFLLDRERKAFTVVSSGTWTIVMANRGDLTRLREERDMLANVNAFGAPIATARYMGGREYEAIAGGAGRAAALPTVSAMGDILARGAMALPSFASAGPYSGRVGRIEGADLDGVGRASLATLYSALMTSELIESLGVVGDVFVDGPLARNPLFAGLLAACVPAGSVRTYPQTGATRVAAFLAGLSASAIPVPEPQIAAPLRLAALRDYQARWRQRLEENS